MEFSATFGFDGVCRLSPDGSLIVSCNFQCVVVRDSDTMDTVTTHTAADAVVDIQWAPDSKSFLCALKDRPVIQVFESSGSAVIARIDCGSTGLAGYLWSSDSRNILTASECELRVSVWSLMDTADNCVMQLRRIKSCPDGNSPCVSFSNDGRWMAAVERSDCRDRLLIVCTTTWSVKSESEVDGGAANSGTSNSLMHTGGSKKLATDLNPLSQPCDVRSAQWSPDSRIICLLDQTLAYRVLLYAADASLVAKIQLENRILGVKCLSWSQDGSLLAIGDFDHCVSIVSHVTWREVHSFQHVNVIRDKVTVLAEEEFVDPSYDKNRKSGRYALQQPPYSVPSSLRSKLPEHSLKRVGVSTAVFSHDCQFVATHDDTYPNVVWIWSIASVGLRSSMSLVTILVHLQPVKRIAWNPTKTQLACCTGSPRLYIWKPAGVYCCEAPKSTMNVIDCQWSYDGSKVIMLDKNTYCAAYPVE